jgi:Zn-dependent peptidase ImmA (M78 family)/DNA-binding XRE family transcriptional regulator
MAAPMTLTRLREAREARGLSLDELAERIGTSRQLVHRYEHGKVTPRPETFIRICAALNVTPDFFTLPEPTDDPFPLFFRHFRSKTSAKQLAAVKRQALWIRDLVARIEETIELPPVAIPDFSPPSDPRTITDQQIEEAATALRRAWGFGDGVIVEVVKLVESKGCIVIRGVVESAAIDAFSKWTRDGRPLIFVDCRDVSAAHSRLDVVHELAHLLLHRAVDPRFVQLNPDTHKLIERQAFRFASAFLMPETTFRKSSPYVSLDNLLLVKTQWQLSVAAMLRRAEDLHMVSPIIARNLWINLARRGWRKSEPLDDLILREDPKILQNALLAIKDGKTSSIAALSARTGLQRSDLERYAGITEGGLASTIVRDFDFFTREQIEVGRKRA